MEGVHAAQRQHLAAQDQHRLLRLIVSGQLPAAFATAVVIATLFSHPRRHRSRCSRCLVTAATEGAHVLVRHELLSCCIYFGQLLQQLSSDSDGWYQHGSMSCTFLVTDIRLPLPFCMLSL